MDDKVRASYKDEILNYLILEKPRAIGVKDIVRIVFKNAITPEQVAELCDDMLYDDADIIIKGPGFSEASYGATDMAEEFIIKYGGYTSHYIGQKNLEHQERVKGYERNNLQDEINRLQKRNLTFFWVPIAISVIALIWSILKPSNDTDRLDKIEDRIELLEKENAQLKEELYKAEMMLKVYESESDSL